MEEKKKKSICRTVLLLLAIVIFLLIAIPFFNVISSSYSVIIKDRELNYYRAGNVFICGSIIICKRGAESAREKTMLPPGDRAAYSYIILSMNDIISIEIEQNIDTETAEIPSVNPQYLGRYRILLQGHEGVMVLGVSKERVYGTVRFPKWGRGAVEYLKGVKISGGGLRFTRSAATSDEIKRLGANYLFTQKFSGSYSSAGKVIKGFMTNDRGEKYEWEAVRK